MLHRNVAVLSVLFLAGGFACAQVRGVTLFVSLRVSMSNHAFTFCQLLLDSLMPGTRQRV